MEKTIDLNMFKDPRLTELMQTAAKLTRTQKTALLSYALSMLSPMDPSLIPEGEPDLVKLFWEFYDKHHSVLNHSRTQVAINLPEYMARYARETGTELPHGELIRTLPYSRCRPFRCIKAVNSRISGRIMKCWCFYQTPDSINLFNWRRYQTDSEAAN